MALNGVLLTEIYNSAAESEELDQTAGFCPGCAHALKNSRGRKKSQVDGPEGAPIFSNQKMTKSDFRDIALAL